MNRDALALFHEMMKTQDGQNAFIRVKKYLADIVAANEPGERK